MNIKHYYYAGLFAFFAQTCIGQTITPDIISTDGGYASNSSGSLNWTIGEPLIETVVSSNNFLTQGFQQPPTIVITPLGIINQQNANSYDSNSDNSRGGNSSISVYPNPVTSSVYITSSVSQPLLVDIMDLAGQKIFSVTLSGNDDNQVNLTAYASGIYLFRVSANGKLLQTLKIDKIK